MILMAFTVMLCTKSVPIYGSMLFDLLMQLAVAGIILVYYSWGHFH